MSTTFKNAFKILVILSTFLAGAFLIPEIGLAQDTGLTLVAGETGLSDTPLPQVIGRLINIALSFVGIIFLVLMILAGFRWMTAGGDEEKVTKAKKTLVNATIGMVLILSSFAISSFVISSIGGAVTDSGSGSGSGSGGGFGSGGGRPGFGGGSSNAFAVSAIRPEGELSIRNVKVSIAFSRYVDEATVLGSVSVTNSITGAVIPGELSVVANRVSFVPEEACPTPNQTRKCFEANTPYDVSISNTLLSTSGTALDCTEGPCLGAFVTGELIDVEDPTAVITAPDSGARVAPGEFVTLQVSGKDDTEIAMGDFFIATDLYDSVPAVGADLSDVIINSTWDTGAFASDDSYRVSVTVFDIAGNEDSDSIQVRINPAHCYNDTQDVDETGLDCGGSCGSCSGAVCSVDSECSSGSCLEGICVEMPVITDFSLDNGAPGTYVTITGNHFGTRAGTIEFNGVEGPVEAIIPSCSAGWTNTEVVVEVPEGAVDGIITLTTRTNLVETTEDDNGAILGSFDVNTELHPSICRVSPTKGRGGAGVSIIGTNFGDSQDSSVVNFNSSSALDYSNWSDSSVNVTVPGISEGLHAITLDVAGDTSNAVDFLVLAAGVGGSSSSDESIPVIGFVTPGSGGIGQYITIAGSSFGNQIGTVRLENQETGYTAIASTNFPEECSERYWKSSEITVIVPEDYTNDQGVANTTHNLYIIRQDGTQSDAVEFSITSAEPTPGICAVVPEIGVAGDTVILYGSSLGSDEGSSTFSNDVTATVSDWQSSQVTVKVPDAATTGPVTLASSEGTETNGINFEVGVSDGENVISDTPVGAGYGWVFSTGAVAQTPEVVIECSDTTISAVPNTRFTSEVCLDAQVYAEFTVPMDEATLFDGDTVVIEECGDITCTQSEVVAGTLIRSTGAAQTSIKWAPLPSYNGGVFKTTTLYRVTITEGAMSVSGEALAADVSWRFTTGGADQICEIERVVVSPDEEFLTVKGEQTEFTALPATGDCQILNPESFTWSWDINESFASITEGICAQTESDFCAVVEAIAEGETDVTAEEDGSGVTGSGFLTIEYTDPYVENFWPNCSEACSNASVGAKFNIGMDTSIQEPGMVTLFECENELCVSYKDVVSDSADCTFDADGTTCSSINFDIAGSLKEGAFYRAVIAGDVISGSGVALTRTNFGDDYTWVFRTKSEDAECGISRIELNPPAVTLHAIGDAQSFTVESFGEPDECSVSGQRLSAHSYDWTWEDPIRDDSSVASFAKIGGELFESDPSGIPNGCTASCLAGGSSTISAICGNGRIEVGEECEDGNISSGDGCSDSCLREGTLDGATCGDSIVNQDEFGAGEDCDDGNLIDGDGCSSLCLNEGARVIGAICGNGDTAFAAAFGGEDCDDGNKKSGDGCSSQCLNEGSRNTVDVTAVCGDGEITSPYETCDDSNLINGDGCSSQCLNEGSSDKYIAPSACGDGIVGIGEDALCENSLINLNQGCTESCLLVGSSVLFSSPSVCGDGAVGVGELLSCEGGVSGNNRIDPVQIATIDATAVENVDIDAGIASATIRVSSALFNVSAESDLTLTCVAETAADCPNGDVEAYGVADNRCCMLRPETAFSPSGINVCRNAAIFVEFNAVMDTATLVDNIFITLDLDSVPNGVCPSDHVIYAPEVALEGGFINRLFARVKNFFAPDTSAQVAGECILPITSYSQRPSTGGMSRVTLGHSVLLRTNGRYVINIKGDNAITAEIEGIKTNFGVGLNDGASAEFTAGERFCSLDVVEVIDTDLDNPGIYRVAGEEHDFVASTFSLSNGSKQEIAPIEGVYDWTWDSWFEDSEGVFVGVSSELGNEAVITASQESGRAIVVAQASIDVDAEGISPPVSTVGAAGEVVQVAQTVSGTERVETIICEDPWPNFDSFPFEDSAEGSITNGITEGIGWMNFSTYYCKNGKLKDSTVIAPPKPGDSEILKEYIFQVMDGSGDAIGFRVAGNSAYLSPLAWYESQGFSGSPEEITVDGFEAVQDGRTVYIAAPNQIDEGASPGLRSNIYIVSYNAAASSNTIDIFNQMIKNMTFAVNLETTGLCHDGIEFTSQVCSADLDCSFAHTCADNKAKLTRDTQRLSDMLTVASAVRRYGRGSGLCSTTTAQSCLTDAECPGVETCEASVPTLQSGTFVRALNTSKWNSWQDNLGQALGADLPVDPLQHYEACGTGDLSGYDSNTCVNGSTGDYVCPADSYVYHYKSIGLFNFEVSAELEYKDSDWLSPIDTFTDLNISIGGNTSSSVSGFTGGNAVCAWDGDSNKVSYGSSAICGDGIIGQDEVCELGQQGPIIRCDVDSSDTIFDDGTKSQSCNSTCTEFVDVVGGECVPFACGNGLVEEGEVCDDGEFNGRYGFCGNSCNYGDAFFCGDGSVAGGESCDCGVDGNGRTIGGGSCTVPNGAYSSERANTCSWDCREPASYCGDGVIDEGETCDGNVDTYAGKICQTGDNGGQTCVTGDDCGLDEYGAANICGGYLASSAFNECPTARLCIDGDQSKIGDICGNDDDCSNAGEVDGICSANTQPTTRTRACVNDGTQPNACEWVQSDWNGTECRGEILCGNGQIDEGETCDDGNDNNTDDCTNTCKANVCGDGFVEKGIEECDEGSQNGELCSASHGSTCSFCSNSCVLLTASGAFCGDGEINGDEFCDAGDIDYSMVSPDGVVLSSCPVTPVGQTPATVVVNTITYTCAQAGVCNGGVDNGKACSNTPGAGLNSCQGGTCVYPTCANDCKSACPFVYEATPTLFTSNLPGAKRESSITLSDFNSSVGGEVADIATAGTMHLAECTAGSSINANVSFDVEDDNVYFIFVTDLGKGMAYSIRTQLQPITSDSTTRLQIAKNTQKKAIDDIYAKYGEDARIALMTYYTSGPGPIRTRVESLCIDPNTGFASQFCDESSQSTLNTKIDSYSVPTVDDFGGQSWLGVYLPNKAIEAAHEEFGSVGEAKKEIVLMSYFASWPSGLSSTEADNAKADGVEIFTVAMPSSNQTFINKMSTWSSGNPNSQNGIDYAYRGTYSGTRYKKYYTTSYSGLYDAVLQAAVPARLGFIFDGSLILQPLIEGNNVPITLPSNFVCDPSGETGVPVRAFFTGGGTISLNSVKMNLCKP